MGRLALETGAGLEGDWGWPHRRRFDNMNKGGESLTLDLKDRPWAALPFQACMCSACERSVAGRT
eukprot:350242-Chlamydomonas_euryale.AAC.6